MVSSKPQINVLFYSLRSPVEKHLNKIALTAGAIMQQNAYLVGSYPVLGALLVVSPLILTSYKYPQECIHSKTFIAHILYQTPYWSPSLQNCIGPASRDLQSSEGDKHTNISCCSPW